MEKGNGGHFWTDEATETLVEAWGQRFLEVNRSNLRPHHWQEIVDTFNSCHGHVSEHRHTDVQCKYRIENLKKKYKAEKARVDGSTLQGPTSDGGVYSSPWRFFSLLDNFINTSYNGSSPATPVPQRQLSTLPSVPQRNLSAMVEFEDSDSDGEETESENWRTSGVRNESPQSGGGFEQVAKAVDRFGMIYKSVEVERQRQMVKLEKHRMKFAKDLEIHEPLVYLFLRMTHSLGCELVRV